MNQDPHIYLILIKSPYRMFCKIAFISRPLNHKSHPNFYSFFKQSICVGLKSQREVDAWWNIGSWVLGGGVVQVRHFDTSWATLNEVRTLWVFGWGGG